MELFNTTLTFMITLLTTVSKSNSKLTNDSVSSVLILHSVITPLSSKLQNTNQIKLEFLYSTSYAKPKLATLNIGY